MEPGDHDIALRPCTPGDAKQLFEWRNHPQIVSLSTLNRTVTWDEHVGWLESRLANAETHRIFIILAGGRECGVIRFDREAREAAMVSVFLAPGWEGQGLGVAALEQGARMIFELWPSLRGIEAHVLKDNRRAARAFGKAGFREMGESSLSNHVLYRRSGEKDTGDAGSA